MSKLISSERNYVPSAILMRVCIVIITMICSGCHLNPYTCDNVPEAYQDLETSTHYIYVLWRAADEPVASFQEMIFDDIVPVIRNRVRKLTVMISEPDIKSITLSTVPREDGATIAAIISVMTGNRKTAEALIDIFKPKIHFFAGYEVLRAIPVNYEKDWPDGDASPGIKQMTLLQKRKDLAYEEFKDYWFCSHTPLALDINPIWRYERNEVVKAMTADAPPYNGIVGLHFQSDEDLTDLNRFFGGNFLVNSLRIGVDVYNFIDMKSIEVIAMTEYIIK